MVSTPGCLTSPHQSADNVFLLVYKAHYHLCSTMRRDIEFFFVFFKRRGQNGVLSVCGNRTFLVRCRETPKRLAFAGRTFTRLSSSKVPFLGGRKNSSLIQNIDVDLLSTVSKQLKHSFSGFLIQLNFLNQTIVVFRLGIYIYMNDFFFFF